ncbi:putative MscS family protein YkuT [Robertmurraya siralis]|uniref:MscS family protein YkuT n=1 Tax=Robertmurraya siralis TaxID=77777 RepID=A0A919WHM6_9BACI|nr:mechanosensitive ion channel family protein [Robertmurraya siralis]PAE19155.1 mechanosensitive ion channel protein [Bacillus sp. 7504-2]GIN61902.1 putative MscS family protein YkuT [Robertmurraya siralis]
MFKLENFITNFDWENLLIKGGVITLKVIGILFAYWIIRRIGRKILDRTFNNILHRQDITEGRALTLHRLAENIFSYALVFILAATLFSVLGIPVASLIAGAGIVGLAVGFGAQGLVSDVVTGFFLLLEKQIDVNDYVTVGNFDGIVEAVGLRTTQIRGFDGTLHFIPNREITSLSNHSRGNMRALVDIGISYEDDIDHAIDVMQQACERVAKQTSTILEGPNVLGVQAFGTSEVVIRVIAKTVNGEQWAIERQLRKAIKEAFDAHGIEIPLPHQVLIQKQSESQQKSLS